MVALASLPFGSNRMLPVAALGTAFAIWAAALTLLRVFEPTAAPLLDRQLRAPVLLLCVVLVWILVQTVPSLSSAPIWSEARRLLGGDVYGSISINPALTLQHFMRLLSYVLVAWLAYLLSGSSDQARRAILAFVAIAAVHAAAGVVMAVFDISPVPLVSFPVEDRRFRGGFVNADHFGFFCGLGLVAATAELLDFKRSEARRTSFDRKLIRATARRFLWSPWRFLGIVLLFAGVLGSQSRGALGATLLALAFLVTFQPGKRGRISIRPFLGLAFVAVVAAALFLSAQPILDRFSAVDDSVALRLSVIKATGYAILDYPWTGSGFGTFPNVYPAYRLGTGDAVGRWSQAHNSFLQNALELGLIAASLFYVAILWFYGACLRGLFRRRRQRLFSHVAVATGLMGAVHSLVDFPLEIPANAYAAMLFLGMGLRQRGADEN